MKKIKSILFLLLCCGVLMYGDGKANVKSTAGNDWRVLEENRLKELRAKAKILFPDIIEYDQISPKHFEQYGTYYVFTMKFSNIIYESGGKIIKVPIFRGTMGNVLYDDFLKYCVTKGLMREGYAESAFQIKFKKGEYTKVLDEFKKFYGHHLSINFKDMPTWISAYSEQEQISTYAFILDGVKCELSFWYPYNEYEATELEYFIVINPL